MLDGVSVRSGPSGDFPACWRFHLAQERRRVHQARYQHPLALAA
jgi:hypothetical protein